MADSIYTSSPNATGATETVSEREREEQLLKLQLNAVSNRTLGWKILRGTGVGNFGQQNLIAAAVYPEDWKRAVKKDQKGSRDYYEFLNGKQGFVLRNSEFKAEEYRGYRFQISEGEKSIRELSEADQSAYAFGVFLTLVRILKEYAAELKKTNKEYIPLLCINKDTVYVQKDSTGKVSVKILVLPSLDNSEALELPREADMGRADISTDLYSVAYLYFAMQYGEKVWEDIKDVKYENREQYIRECLQPFSEWRITAEQLLEHLNIEGGTAYFMLPKEGVKKPVVTEREKSENDTNSEVVLVNKQDSIIAELKKIGKKIKLFGKIGSWFKSIAQKKKSDSKKETADADTVDDPWQ